ACFFVSSRRRHTRSKRDWSSDVCSSDLFAVLQKCPGGDLHKPGIPHQVLQFGLFKTVVAVKVGVVVVEVTVLRVQVRKTQAPARSEERRVGRESKPRGGASYSECTGQKR